MVEVASYTDLMQKPFRALVLVAMLLWQSLAWLTPQMTDRLAGMVAHEVVHVDERDHHHHEDGSLHLGEDESATTHFHPDGGLHPPAVASLGAGLALADLDDVLVEIGSAQPPRVFLPALLRPPSQAA